MEFTIRVLHFRLKEKHATLLREFVGEINYVLPRHSDFLRTRVEKTFAAATARATTGILYTAYSTFRSSKGGSVRCLLVGIHLVPRG